MRLSYLHTRLTSVVAMLIVGSVLATAMIMAIHHNRHVHESTLYQGSHLVNALSLAVNEPITTGDRNAVEKVFLDYLSDYPMIAYLSITQDDHILAYASLAGLPTELQNAHFSEYNHRLDLVRSATETGERYVHLTVPIANDPVMLLHMGLNSSAKQPMANPAWLPTVLAGILVLCISLTLAFVLFRKMTLPLRRLAQEAEKADRRHPTIDWPTSTVKEVNGLSTAMAGMLEQLSASSRQIEALSDERDLANRQLFGSFEIIRTVGDHSSLQDVCAYLIGKLKTIMTCGDMAIVTASRNHNRYFLYIQDRLEVVSGESMEAAWRLLSDMDGYTFVQQESVRLPLIGEHFHSSSRIGVFPIHFENQKLGALLVGCPTGCRCRRQQLEIVDLLLQECAGAVKRAINHADDLQNIQCQIGQKSQFCGIVGKDRRMQTVFKLINDIAPTDAAVLIQGESGTGKELVARAIHERGLRRDKPFVVINCSAYPASLLESELFGHEKGAFTGAIRQKIGRFEQADGGTVFLDEIGEIAPSAQINLLRVLQTQTFERIGGEKTLHVQVRIIAATNKDLLSEVQKGTFREDLYYRLNVIPMYLPPLRKRSNDIPLLARYFLNQFKREQRKPAVRDFSTETMRRLLEYSWPGNVRELENTIEHALVLTKSDNIEVSALPANIRLKGESDPSTPPRTIIENEKKLFEEILEETGWNKKLAAKRLGISRSTLYNKIKRYRLTSPTIH